MKSTKYLAAAALISITLSACSPADGGKVVSYNNNNENSAQISFAWWGNDGRISYTMDAIDIFRELNPDIDVRCKYGVWAGYDRRQNIYMLSHEAPDVMQINFDWINKYSSDGEGFYDLYQLSDQIDLSNFSESDLNYGIVNGKLNAIPIALNTHSIFINKDIYDKYGVDIPKSWDDYFKAAEIMKKDGIYPISMGDKPLFFFLLSYLEQTTGHSACNNKGELALTKEDIKLMLEFYGKLMDEKVLMPVHDSDFASFATGVSAATMRWISGSQSTFDGLFRDKVNIVVAPYPTVSGNVEDTQKLGWYVKPATMYAVNSKTENPEEAGRLLDYLLNSEEMALLQKTEKGIPVSESAMNTLKENGELDNIDFVATEQMLDYEDKMAIMYPILEKSDVYMTFYEEAAYYIYKENSLEEVTDKIYGLYYK